MARAVMRREWRLWRHALGLRPVIVRGVVLLLQYTVVASVLITLNFALPRLAPGDPLDFLLGDQALQLGPEERREILSQFGLDQPLRNQFIDYLAGLSRGDLGTSVRYGRPVAEVIGERLPWTVALVGLSILLSSLIGVVMGTVAAWHRGRAQDAGMLSVALALNAMPMFWIGMFLLGVFAVELNWLPIAATVATAEATAASSYSGTIELSALPIVTLTLGSLGGIVLITRASMINVLGEDFILAAEATGLSEARIALAHALRNSSLAIVTVVLLNVGHLFGGAVVVETIFSYPGLGRLLYESALARDYPLLQGAFLLVASGVVAANFLGDLLYPMLDPRVRRIGSVH